MGLHPPPRACQVPGWPLRETKGVGTTAPSFFVKLTVHVPLDAPGRKFQGFVDLLQDSLQLLLLSYLRLGDFGNIQLLALKLL